MYTHVRIYEYLVGLTSQILTNCLQPYSFFIIMYSFSLFQLSFIPFYLSSFIVDEDYTSFNHLYFPLFSFILFLISILFHSSFFTLRILLHIIGLCKPPPQFLQDYILAVRKSQFLKYFPTVLPSWYLVLGSLHNWVNGTLEKGDVGRGGGEREIFLDF